MQRNGERYQFLRWGQAALNQFRVVPPGTGICHQVNLEYLAQVVWSNEVDGQGFAFSDTLFGTDSQFIHHILKIFLQFHPTAAIYAFFYSLRIVNQRHQAHVQICQMNL